MFSLKPSVLFFFYEAHPHAHASVQRPLVDGWPSGRDGAVGHKHEPIFDQTIIVRRTKRAGRIIIIKLLLLLIYCYYCYILLLSRAVGSVSGGALPCQLYRVVRVAVAAAAAAVAVY